MENFIIYKTTNLINGKIYIGQHCTSANDGYLGSGKIINLAIKKYGKRNFMRETIDYCNGDNVDAKEIYWINELNSQNPEIGYNIENGGNGKGKHTEQWKEMIRLLLSGENNPFYGKKHSNKTKKYLSSIRKGTRLGEKNTFYGKTHAENSKKLIGASSKQRTKYIYFFISPDGKEYNNIVHLQDFCNQFNWTQNNLKFVNNMWTKYKGWQIKKVYKEN
jgi:group I intron endonuclease